MFVEGIREAEHVIPAQIISSQLLYIIIACALAVLFLHMLLDQLSVNSRSHSSSKKC